MPDHVAANADSYHPPEFSDDAFVSWAHRIMLKVLNLSPGAQDHVMRRVLVSEGVPSPTWAQAFTFMLELSRNDKRKAVSA